MSKTQNFGIEFFLDEKTSRKEIARVGKEYLRNGLKVYRELRLRCKVLEVRYIDGDTIKRQLFCSPLTKKENVPVCENEKILNIKDATSFFTNSRYEIMNVSILSFDFKERINEEVVYNAHLCFGSKNHRRSCTNWIPFQYRKV